MGIGILVPTNSPVGMIFGLISILLIIFFVIIIIGAFFSSVLGGIIGFIGFVNDEKDLWYHKKDKSNGIAFLCSLLLPFSGNLYLKENEFNFVTTIISIFILMVTIWGLISIPDFYIHNGYVITILILLWIVSLISLGINIKQYNKYKGSYPPNKKTKFESICGNKLFSAIPIIIFILFLSVNLMTMTDTSDKFYENEYYSLIYPNDYIIGDRDSFDGQNGNIYTDFEKSESSSKIIVTVYDTHGSSLNDGKTATLDQYKEMDIPIKNHKSITVDGVKGYCIEYEGHWKAYTFFKGDTGYTFCFQEGTYDSINEVLDSIKFKSDSGVFNSDTTY